jgi:ribonuclease D
LPSLTTATPIFSPPTAEFRERRKSVTVKNPIEEAMHAWRTSKARNMRVDPDTVLSPRQLLALARSMPQNLSEVEEITDPVFAHRYGQEILSIIRSQ